MQILVTFSDDDLKDPIVKNQLLNWLGVAHAGGPEHHFATRTGATVVQAPSNGEDHYPEPAVPSQAEPSPSPVASPKPPTTPPTAPARGRPTSEEKAEAAAKGISVKDLRDQKKSVAATQPTPPHTVSHVFPPGVNAQPPGGGAPPLAAMSAHAPSAAMPPATPPTGDSLTELQEWGRRLDSKRPGATFQILSDSGFIATAGIPPERVPEFVMRFKTAHDQL